jgi:hypothetical protein
MNSITMHIFGGLVQAAMKSTTFGCRSTDMTCASLRKLDTWTLS